MDLQRYITYVAVTSTALLVLSFIILTFKAWMDRRTFRSNTIYAVAMQKASITELFSEDKTESFNDHVASTPGIKDLN